MKTFVIAEAGSTHDWAPGHGPTWRSPGRGSPWESLIMAARAAGADAVKFQWTSDPGRLAARRNAPELAAPYMALAWPARWHAQLGALCLRAGLEYMCTVYLPEDIAEVAPYVRRFKISSFEAGDDAFIRAHRPFQGNPERPLIVSHGLGSTWSDRAWFAPTVHLHCVSAYPCPLEQLNLRVITPWTKYQGYGEVDEWPGYDGLSDHSAHVLTGALAVAAGAEVLEVHFRLDATAPTNPDFTHSLTPAQLGEYVRNVRLAEAMLGDGIKRVMPAEAGNVRYRVTP